LYIPGQFDTARHLMPQIDVEETSFCANLIRAAISPHHLLTSPWPAGMHGVDLFSYLATHKPAPPPPPATPDLDLIALTRACVRPGASYPYMWVRAALDGARLPAAARLAWMREALQAAAAEHTARGAESTYSFLDYAHKNFAPLDALTEDAATANLAALATSITAAPPVNPLDRSERLAHGNRLLTLLTQLDPDRAGELRLQYSLFQTPAVQMEAPTHPISELLEPQRAANADPAAALQKAMNTPAGSARFQALLQTAINLSGQHPAEAAQAADAALDAMDDDLLGANLEDVSKLAERMNSKMHENPQAEQLIARCLDAAEQQAEALQSRFNAATPDERPAVYDGFILYPGEGMVEAFTYAAQIDPALALARAERTSSALLKPLFLTAAATRAK
ncbi:MAG: hypothetical protein ACRD1E_10970, partial [Terriglobales bacterium]